MTIEILEFEEGARKAKGLTVIIDVFRAFSVACYAYSAGVNKIITTSRVPEAFRLKQEYPDSVLAGERNEKKIEGFDFGNSPSEIIRGDIKGKTLIHTTTAGTAGLANALNADVLLTGSLVNAGAVAQYIKTVKPAHVSLVAMGYRATISAEEDLLCAEIIASRLRNENMITGDRIKDLVNTSGKRFFNPENEQFSPPSDFFLCTMINRFNFVLRAVKRPDNNIELQRIDAV
jgi:2-phosphosulfolactate phosphatase